MAEQYRSQVYMFKLLLLGDSGVGKSCCLIRFSDDTFSESFTATVGIDFKIRTMVIGGRRCSIQIWDTAGQEKFLTITKAYYRAAGGILIVYDVTKEQSFKNVRTWISRIEENTTRPVNKILIGNKCDCDEEERQVPTEQGQALADELGIPFMEVSAKSNINIEEAFTKLLHDVDARGEEEARRHALQQQQQQQEQQSVPLGRAEAVIGEWRKNCC